MATRVSSGDRYRLTGLVQSLVDRKQGGSVELGISELLATRSEIQLAPSTRHGLGAFLPTRSFARSLGHGTPSTGGDLASGGIAAVATATRPATILEELGADRLEVAGNSGLSLPAWRPMTGSGWIGEDAAAPEIAVSIATAEASGRMAAARVAYTRRMKNQAAEAFEASILREVEAEVRKVAEGGFIAGSGSNAQPLGLINTPGAGATTFAAALPTAAELAAMMATYAAASGDLAAARFLMNPADVTALLSAGRIAWLDNNWRAHGVPVIASTHVTSGKVLLIDPRTVAIAYFGPPQLVVDTSSNGKSIRGDTELIILNLCDIAIRNRDLVVVGSV
jgi:hypothetical protein